MALHPTQIIKKPLVTEKSAFESSERNRYSFEVVMSATKEEIGEAVASIYNVRVKKVRTQIRKGGQTRNRFGYMEKKPWKKALVELHDEDVIEFI